MTRCNMQANDKTTTANNWKTPGTSDSGRHNLHVASYWIDTLVLKNQGKYLRYFAAPPFPLQGKTNASSQEVARRISGAVAGEVRSKVKTHQVPITKPYLPHYIICHLPLVFLPPLHPCHFIRPLSLSVLPLFLYLPLFACFLFACLLDCLLVSMALPRFGDLHLKSKAMLGVLWSCNLSIIVSLETSLRNKKFYEFYE